MKSLLFTIALAICFVVPSLAPAEELDTIVLRNGTVLRGQVSKLVPGKIVQIKLVSGELQTLELIDVARMQGPSFPASSPASAQPNPEAGGVAGGSGAPLLGDRALAWQLPAAGRSRVDLRSAGPGEQEISVVVSAGMGMVGSTRASWFDYVRVCKTPCSIYARTGQPLSLLAGGPNIRAHAAELEVPAGGVELTLHAPNARQFLAGFLMGSFGIAAGIGGLIAGPIGLTHREFDTSVNKFVVKPNVALTAAGFTLLGAGLIVTTVGFVLLKRNRGGIQHQRALQLALGRVEF